MRLVKLMLLDTLQLDLASAQKNRDQVKIDTLRFLMGAIRNLEIEKYPPSKSGSLTDEDVISTIKKQVKTHRESIEMFGKANRQDLVDREKAELGILQSYLPPEMSEEELKSKLLAIKTSNPGADFGTLMKLAMSELKGAADGSLVSRILKEQSTSN